MIYTVGEFIPMLKTGEIQMRAMYDGTWTIFVLFPNMSKQEAININSGAVSVGFVVIEDELFLLGKLGEIPWFDTPFEPARCQSETYPDFEEGAGVPILFVGADSNTGVIQSIRLIGASNAMSNALHAVCRDMKTQHSPLDIKKQNAHYDKIYRKYPSSEAMLKEANPNHFTVILR